MSKYRPIPILLYGAALMVATTLLLPAMPAHPVAEAVQPQLSMAGSPVALHGGPHDVYLPLVRSGSTQPGPLTQVFRVPYSSGNASGVRLPEMAVFWFGQVDPTRNSVDVRLGFSDIALVVDVAVIDRQLWHDNVPHPNSLTSWDAVSLYLDVAGPTGTSPGPTTYRLVAQAGSGPGYQRAERGTGSGWAAANVPFTTTLLWRGDAFNTPIDDHGWALQFEIPFSSLGLDNKPVDGTTWALALVVHDRDDAVGTFIPDTPWPAGLLPTRPASWGRISVGWPEYVPPPATWQGSTVLRQGLNGVSVPDAHVGGHTTCGYGGANMWAEWGGRVWSGIADNGVANIQNQRDISDWPCFSRYYLNFPLAGHIPAGKTIVSATLTLHLTGGSGADASIPPSRSLIQVLTINDDWHPDTISWNNAPLAVQNVSRAIVEPHPSFPGWPGLPYVWDMTYAVAAAHAAGQTELRLAVYSADGAIHSGKYFATSATGDFSAVSRPTLAITWGEPLYSAADRKSIVRHGYR